MTRVMVAALRSVAVTRERSLLSVRAVAMMAVRLEMGSDDLPENTSSSLQSRYDKRRLRAAFCFVLTFLYFLADSGA